MNEVSAPLSNIPEYGVAEISGAVKRTLEGAFGRVRVRGEVTECKRYPSGHYYFSLKEDSCKLAAVAWKSAVAKLGLIPENGVEVIAQGKLTGYGDRSSYQLVVERIEYAGIGALLARIESIRTRLAGEGLFDTARKRALPRLPELVGVVTSERGAVIQDIRTTIERRFPRHILLWPVPVQGEGSAEKIAAAITGFGALARDGAVPRPDVLIVARGGGGLEDLMAFNEECVVRAAAECPIPLISAVGHETDTTLIDFASDRRAPTPTAAAELAVPSRAELAADLAHSGARLLGALGRMAGERRLALQRAERLLPDLPTLLATGRQRLDDRAGRLDIALPNLVARRHAALVAVERRMPDLASLLGSIRQRLDDRAARLTMAPGIVLAARRAALVGVERRIPNLSVLVERRRAALALVSSQLRGALRHAVAARAAQASRVTNRLSDAALRSRLREARARLDGLAGRLEAVSHERVLARGYAMVFDMAGHPLTTAASVRPATALRLHFGDGDVRATSAGRGDARQGALPL